MSALSPRPVSLVRVEFDELYARHLCRHSQWGINAAHLAALLGVWLGVYGVVLWLTRTPWVLPALAGAYLAVMVPSLPPRVTAVTAVFLAGFLAALLSLPLLPVWAYLLLIPVCYKLQSWSHRVFTVATDMSDFDRKYTRGTVLFFVLLFYEVPIVLNYLVFDRRSWA